MNIENHEEDVLRTIEVPDLDIKDCDHIETMNHLFERTTTMRFTLLDLLTSIIHIINTKSVKPISVI